MPAILIAILVFLLVFGGVLLGMHVRTVLPEQHCGPEAKEVFNLGIGLIGTPTALILALVTSSAKTSFDSLAREFNQTAVNKLILNRTVTAFRPETREIRQQLLRGLARKLELTWPEGRFAVPVAQIPDVESAAEEVPLQIRQLTAQNGIQRALQTQALDTVREFVKARWILQGGVDTAIPTPFLVIQVLWLTVIFASYGLYAMANAIAITVPANCVASVAGSVFLNLELKSPFAGLMRVSGAALRYALSQLGP